MELTWAGWLFVVDMSLSVLVWLCYALTLTDRVKTAGESFWSAVACGLYLILFFTVGFTK